MLFRSGFNEQQLQQARLEFWNSKELDSEMQGKPYKDVHRHFLNWCRVNKDRLKHENLRQNVPRNQKTSKPTVMDYLEINRLAKENISDE